MTAGREEAEFKLSLETLIAEFVRRADQAAPAAYAGAAEDTVLEHTARKHFLDKLLLALGWDISSFEHDIAEEARVRDDTTVFMDYVGVHPQSRSPVLIFEAKAWEKPFPAASAAALASRGGKGKIPHVELISMALMHCKANEDEAQCPVSLEWRGWLLKLTQYVTAVKTESGHLVGCVAISSGQWIVVFKDPANAFVDKGVVNTDAISVFRIEDYVANSDDIYQQLARCHLIGAPPPFIRPEQATAYLSVRAAKKLFLGLWIRCITTGSAFDVHPQILIYPAILIQRADEEFVTVVDSGLGHDPIPNDSSAIELHIDATRNRSNNLLATIQAVLPGLPAPSELTEFPGFMQPPSRGRATKVFEPDDADRDFLKSYPLSAGQFVVATGRSPHFIIATPRVAGCRGHDWAQCKSLNENVGDRPVVSRSVQPASFFISGELHHCAYRLLHGRRLQRCKIRAFDNFMCCQACTYQPVCWGGHRRFAVRCRSARAGGTCRRGSFSGRPQLTLSVSLVSLFADYRKFLAFTVGPSGNDPVAHREGQPAADVNRGKSGACGPSAVKATQ